MFGDLSCWTFRFVCSALAALRHTDAMPTIAYIILHTVQCARSGHCRTIRRVFAAFHSREGKGAWGFARGRRTNRGSRAEQTPQFIVRWCICSVSACVSALSLAAPRHRHTGDRCHAPAKACHTFALHKIVSTKFGKRSTSRRQTPNLGRTMFTGRLIDAWWIVQRGTELHARLSG